MHSERQGPKSRKSSSFVWAPPGAVPAEPSAPVCRCETHLDESVGELSKACFGLRDYCLGVGHIVGCRGRAVCTGFMGSLGQEPKAEQGRG